MKILSSPFLLIELKAYFMQIFCTNHLYAALMHDMYLILAEISKEISSKFVAFYLSIKRNPIALFNTSVG